MNKFLLIVGGYIVLGIIVYSILFKLMLGDSAYASNVTIKNLLLWPEMLITYVKAKAEERRAAAA